MTRYILLSLSLLISSTAIAGGGRAPVYTENNSERPSADRGMEVELLNATSSRDGGMVSEIAVDGDTYTVEVGSDSSQGSLSLYGPDGEFIVGYFGNRVGAAIFDSDGLVDQGAAGELSMAPMAEYGEAAMLLSDVGFLTSFLKANDVTFGDDDGPSAMWWVPVAYLVGRCLDLELSYTSNSDGSSSTTASIGWDC